MPEFEVQVAPEHYEWNPYHSPARWASFWHQIDEVVRTKASTCVEIGVGSGIVMSALRSFGVEVTGIDIEPALGVDRVGDIRALPCEDREFGVSVACQVLEHLPWTEVPRAVAELQRVAKSHVIISLPQSGRPVRLAFELPTGQRFAKAESLSARRPLPEGEEHFWQVGSAGCTRRDVRAVLEAGGNFEIVSEYVVPQNAYHRFYVLKRR